MSHNSCCYGAPHRSSLSQPLFASLRLHLRDREVEKEYLIDPSIDGLSRCTFQRRHLRFSQIQYTSHVTQIQNRPRNLACLRLCTCRPRAMTQHSFSVPSWPRSRKQSSKQPAKTSSPGRYAAARRISPPRISYLQQTSPKHTEKKPSGLPSSTARDSPCDLTHCQSVDVSLSVFRARCQSRCLN